MEKLLQTLVDTGSEHAVIDITGVPAVDTQVAQHLLKTMVAARLMGAECVISGIRPQEAASNLVRHAVEGVMLIRPHPEPASAVEVVAMDRGPGMHDVSRALRDGYSTGGTLGIGLGGIARMASGYDVHSVPGRGTVLGVCFTARGAALPPSRVSGVTRPIGEEAVCGDAFAVVEDGASTTVMVCDGLGHGEAAALASREAVRVFLEYADRHSGFEPVSGLERIHSDGLSDRWDVVSHPGLVARAPSVAAVTLLRDAGTRRDDACVVTVRPAA
ncbi:STAS domain-containing protein [Planomonospora parontospora]|uniref:STAS domain-containing protein n=1 Tax=Planomonospora parontospora TaxID=58119 RepID=UPI00198E66DA|nr:STAS domain-containing protein [Planomonospora parontospora]GGL01930.1 hypothetical protein GCM10014719_00160 [Planomonospora parontospora subsp. antibiotica]GII16812.1 hypothetical protein Ppa05_35380 [Planomonospora parontospora subsp. antibiotica]